MRAVTTTSGAALPAPYPLTDADFERYRALVHRETGVALGDSKRELLRARLGNRLRHWGYTTFAEYWRHLRARDPYGEELECLISAVTTHKTAFFREPAHFDVLRTDVLRPIARDVAAGRPLRVWSAGCSTGEEAYSVAMTVLDAVPELARADVRILGSDIDTRVLAIAGRGVYGDDAAAAIPPLARTRYVERTADGDSRVRPEVRRLVTFRRIDLHDSWWPIRTRFDAIFCRNVVIYFDKPTQRRVVLRLIDLLRPGGCLFLGHSESLLGLDTPLAYLGHTTYRKPAEPETRASRA